MSKTETLYCVGNLSKETMEEVEKVREMFITLADFVEKLGSSRELSESFTHIETAQMYAIKHLCLEERKRQKEIVA